MEDFWIPRNLDASPLVFIWEADIFVIHIIFIVLGFLMEMLVFGFLLSIAIGRGYSILKEEGGSGLILKILYWFTPSNFLCQNYLPSNIREYTGG